MKIQKNVVLHRGFTLMELLVVIAILGMLIIAGLASFTSSQKKSRDLRRKNDLRQIALAMETYYNDYDSYPLSEVSTNKIQGCWNDAVVSSCDWGMPWKKTQTTGSSTVYMITLPADPLGTHAYVYESDGTYFKLYASLENELDTDVGAKQAGYGVLTCGGVLKCTYGIASSNTTLE